MLEYCHSRTHLSLVAAFYEILQRYHGCLRLQPYLHNNNILQTSTSNPFFLSSNHKLYGLSDGEKVWRAMNIPGSIKAVTNSLAHTLLLTKEGELYGVGWNHFGELEIEDDSLTQKDWRVNTTVPEPPVRLYAAIGHSFFLTATGRLYAIGCSSYGALGLPIEGIYDGWTLVPTPQPVLAVITDDTCTFILTVTGDLYGVGESVALTKGCNAWQYLPFPVPVAKIVASPYDVFALMTNGEVYGIGDLVNSVTWKLLPLKEKMLDVVVGHKYCLLLSVTGKLYGREMGGMTILSSSVPVPTPVTPVLIFIDSDAAYFLGEDGQLYTLENDRSRARENWTLAVVKG